MISSGLPEVIKPSRRVMVMRNGQAAGIVDRRNATGERLLQLMAGRDSTAA